MNVLIVGKTKMAGSSRCIVGILEDGTSVRMIKPDGQWDATTKFEIGEVWDIEFTHLPGLIPPHTEDILVTKYEYVRNQAGLSAHIISRIPPCQGGIGQVFNGTLNFTDKNNGFISARGEVPDYSMCFWIPNKDLTLRPDGNHYDYSQSFSPKGMGYGGEQVAIQTIPAGTLVRLSLARWWKPEDVEDLEERCYLQLSGWF